MNYQVMIVLAFFCLIQAYLAHLDGSFWGGQSRKVNLSYLRNVTISIGDQFVLPIVAGLIVPHLQFAWWWLVVLVVALVATYFFHIAWWPGSEPEGPTRFYGHIFSSMEKSGGHKKQWYRDLTPAGYIHFVFMVVLLLIVTAFIVTPMPAGTVWLIFGLMLAFMILQGTVCILKGFMLIDVISVVGQTIALIGITFYKVS